MTQAPRQSAVAEHDDEPGGPDVGPALLRAMVDLYVQAPDHTEEEQQRFTELALYLIERVDADTRVSVAHTIAGYPAAPAPVRRRLLREVISVVPPCAPAEASGSEAQTRLAGPIARELSELFLTASAEARRLIVLNLPYAAFAPAAPLVPAAAQQAMDRLDAAARRADGEAFSRELARTFGLSPEFARRLVADELGEPMAVAAAALGLSAAALQRMLLCLDPEERRPVQRIHELAALREEFEPDAALRLVAIWQAAEPAGEASLDDAEFPPDGPGVDDAPAMLPPRPKIRWEDYALSQKAESANELAIG